MRALAAAVLMLAIVSCNAAPTAAPVPTGSLAPIARNLAALVTPNADIPDAPFDEFLAALDLPKTLGASGTEIVDALRRTRALVATAPRSSRGAGPHVASPAAVIGVFIVPEFARTLADALDPFTKKAGTAQTQPRPLNETDDGPTTTTTTSLNITTQISSTGPRVTLTMHWTFHSTAKDKQSGAVLVDLLDERTMVGAITVCPDGQGQVGSSIDVHSTFSNTTKGTTTTQDTTSSSVFTGHVDDSAVLRSVNQTLQDKQTGTNTYEAIVSTSYAASSGGNFLQGLNTSDFTGSFNAADTATAERVGRLAAFSLVLDALALDPAYGAAQKLWRNGRCVMVSVPTYNAETPIEVGEQEKTQHDEAVDASSETKVSVNLKHRFEGGAPSQPVTATLTSGGKKLEPGRLDAVPGSITYTAPDERDKKASAKLQTTSKRGIGTLVLDFHTGQEALTLTLSGTGTSHLSFLGTTSDQTVQVTLGPVEFKRLVGDMWSGTGTWQSTTHSETVNSISSNTCDGAEMGTVEMEAEVQTRAGQRVWVIKRGAISTDGAGSEKCVNSLGGTTIRGVTLPSTITNDTDGGSAELFITPLEEIVIPADGGTVAVRGSRTVGGTALSATGTAKAVTRK